MQGLQRSHPLVQLADVLGSLCYSQNDLLPVREHMRGARADVEMGKVGLGTWDCGKHPVDGLGNFDLSEPGFLLNNWWRHWSTYSL